MATVQKSVLITGASKGGIGYALAEEYHKQGYLVLAGVRTLRKLSSLAEKGVIGLELDVTNQNAIDAAVKTVESKTGGRLDILVSNSGAG
jgi:1-acylglycerone phosphate reductase